MPHALRAPATGLSPSLCCCLRLIDALEPLALGDVRASLPAAPHFLDGHLNGSYIQLQL